MIRANARSRLTTEDLDLVLELLANGSSAARLTLEARLYEEGPDSLLDDPSLFGRLADCRTIMNPSSILFIYVALRHHLLQACLSDVELADYLAALIADFGLGDRSCRVAAGSGRVSEYLVDLIAASERADGEERFLVLTHLGNFSLWHARLFPDRIAARRKRRGGPNIEYFDQMGRLGFAAASGHALAKSAGLGEVLSIAAESFPSLRATLNRLSDEVLFPDYRGTDRYLRGICRAIN